jgi:hypothetical protein
VEERSVNARPTTPPFPFDGAAESEIFKGSSGNVSIGDMLCSRFSSFSFRESSGEGGDTGDELDDEVGDGIQRVFKSLTGAADREVLMR